MNRRAPHEDTPLNSLIDNLLHSDFGAPAGGVEGLLFALLLAVVIGQAIGWLYQVTHRALSYSQTFVSSLVVMPPLVALMMHLMAGNMIIAFGLLAVFAIVRFRNVLKDTRDTTFILWSIIEGMSVGTRRFSTALIGLVCLATLFAYLRVTLFGNRPLDDASVRLSLLGDLNALQARVRDVLDRHCLRIRPQISAVFVPVSGTFEVAFGLQLRDPNRHEELRQELAGQAGISNVSLTLHHEEWEM